MYLLLIQTNTKILDSLKNYFPKNYLESLKYKQEESIIARFFVSKLVEKYFWVKKFLPQIDENWIPIFNNNFFWSISHKENLIFVWISKTKIGIDLEIIKKRDKSLLNIFSLQEYKLLWWKNWENF